MFCTFKTLAACFSLSGIYVDASAVYDDNEIVRYYDAVQRVDMLSPLNGSSTPAIGIVYRLDQQQLNRDPYGQASLGYAIDFSASWSFHLSYARKFGDYEANRYSAGITWKPFAR